MITVYVWKPMWHDGLDNILANIRSYEKRNSGYERTSGSEFDGNLMRNPFAETEFIVGDESGGINKIRSQLKNFVLTSRDTAIEEFQRLVGHASLLVELEDGRSEYLSFWPARDEKYFEKSDFIDSYKRDISKMKKKADDPVSISNLNDIKVYEFILKCKNQQKNGENYVNYNIFFKNCSTLVMSALLEGTQTSPFAKTKGFFQKAWKSLEAAGVYSLVITAAIDGFNGDN